MTGAIRASEASGAGRERSSRDGRADDCFSRIGVVRGGRCRRACSWHRHSRHDDAAVVEAIVPGHGLSGCDPAVGFPALSSLLCQASIANCEFGTWVGGERGRPSSARIGSSWGCYRSRAARRGPQSGLGRVGRRRCVDDHADLRHAAAVKRPAASGSRAGERLDRRRVGEVSN
jgi:hypothetical protein